MGLLEKYYAGQDDGLKFENQPAKVLVRPWYYFAIVALFWTSLPFHYIGGFFAIIIHVIHGDIELPPDRPSHIAFWMLASVYILVIGAALYFSFIWWLT